MAESNPGAARFTRKLSDEQRQAILKAHYIEGHKGAAIIRMAQAGQLASGPFKLTKYVYDVINDGRDKFEAENPEAVQAGIRRRIEEVSKLALDKSRGLNADEATLKDLVDVVKQLNDVRKVNVGESKAAAPEAPKAKGVLGDLLEMAEEKAA